jgi:hypothetical protein
VPWCAGAADRELERGVAAGGEDAGHLPVVPDHAAISQLIAAKRPGRLKAGNQRGVPRTYRNYCRPPTGTASATCRPGTGTKVSSIYRDRTTLRGPVPPTNGQQMINGMITTLGDHAIYLVLHGRGSRI